MICHLMPVQSKKFTRHPFDAVARYGVAYLSGYGDAETGPVAASETVRSDKVLILQSGSCLLQPKKIGSLQDPVRPGKKKAQRILARSTPL